MRLFDFLKNDSTEMKIRRKLASAFDDAVNDVVTSSESKGLIDNPMFGGLLVQGAIGNLYQSLKNGDEASMLSLMCSREGLDYHTILDEECNKALDKYLETSK